jgi:radical SAM protein with 4Fe4S-binding SPASM domain
MTTKPVNYWGANRQYNAKHKRRSLPKAMPVSTPFLVNIDPTNLCNLRCRFCPTGHPELLEKFDRPRGVMDFDLFTKVVDDLTTFPEKVKVLLLHKDGEPMINPRLGDMLKYAKEKDFAEVIWLTTNMTLLTSKLAEDIVDSGVDFIRVSVNHVTNQGYKDLTLTWSDYDKVRANTEMLYEIKTRKASPMKIWAKLNDFNLTPEEIEKFGRDFKDISDDHMLANPMGWTYGQEFDFRLGVNTGLGQEGEVPLKENRVVCPYPFYRMVVNFNGDISVCELDWTMSTVVGNARSESMWDIWNGERTHAFRLMMLEGRRWSHNACKQCSCVTYMPPDNDMDDHQVRLLELYNRLGANAPAKAWGMRENGTWVEPE